MPPTHETWSWSSQSQQRMMMMALALLCCVFTISATGIEIEIESGSKSEFVIPSYVDHLDREGQQAMDESLLFPATPLSFLELEQQHFRRSQLQEQEDEYDENDPADYSPNHRVTRFPEDQDSAEEAIGEHKHHVVHSKHHSRRKSYHHHPPGDYSNDRFQEDRQSQSQSQSHTQTQTQMQMQEVDPQPQTSSSSSSSSSSSESGSGSFGPCKTCVFVLERIKKGTNMLLPAICSEIYIHFPDAYAMCHQVLNALSLNGNNVRYWLFEGCYKYEIYQAKEWVKPCPSHVMCTVLKMLNNNPFCHPLPMENPFAEDSEGSAAAHGAAEGTPATGTPATGTPATDGTTPPATGTPAA